MLREREKRERERGRVFTSAKLHSKEIDRHLYIFDDVDGLGL